METHEFLEPLSFSEYPAWAACLAIRGNIRRYGRGKAVYAKLDEPSQSILLRRSSKDTGREEICAAWSDVQIAILVSRMRKLYYF